MKRTRFAKRGLQNDRPHQHLLHQGVLREVPHRPQPDGRGVAQPDVLLRGLQVNWRRNGKKLSRRKAIREEASRRIQANRNDDNAHQVRDWAHQKIRRFYDVVPLCDVWPIRRAG